MHPSSQQNFNLFCDVYLEILKPRKILEIGSLDVNGSIRNTCPKYAEFVGVDLEAGQGVDIVIDNPYYLPFPNGTFDCIVASSVFEHSNFFWELFNEIMRVLSPGGLVYINAPSNGKVHRFPVDAWRFYPDAGSAMVEWSQKKGHNSRLIESYISEQKSTNNPDTQWNDWVGIFTKDTKKNEIINYPANIHSKLSNFIGLRTADKKVNIPTFEDTQDFN